MILPDPYYSENGITIYHGDCRNILPHLEPVDLVLTDPPYGIARVWKGGLSSVHGWANAGALTAERNSWDGEPPSDELINACISAGAVVCIWGGNYFDLPPSRGWLVWNKPERNFTLAEAELAWTNKDMVVRVFDGNRSEPFRQHPTQKTEALMSWCIERLGGQTILDPFMGSGTTLVAARDLGRRAIGVEIERKYCDIAIERLRQRALPLSVEERPAHAEQEGLYGTSAK